MASRAILTARPASEAELREDLRIATDLVAAAELDVIDRREDENKARAALARAESNTAAAERCVKAAVGELDAAWGALRRSIAGSMRSVMQDEIDARRRGKVWPEQCT